MASTINAAISGLIGALEAAALTGVKIHDGEPLSYKDDWIAVGYQPGRTEAVEAEYAWAQIGGQKSEEQYDLLCSLSTRSGNTNMAAGRTRAIELRDAVAAAISADRTLGGAVRLAHLSSATLHQEQDDRGRLVGFAFSVSIQARITT